MGIQITPPPEGLRGSRVDVGLIRDRAQFLLSRLGHRNSELSIALVDDSEIRKLNREWRGLDRATDVLSFSLLEGEGSGYRGRLLGDVIIGVERAAAQAADRHRGLDDEVTRLMIHGLLHVLGHDHESEVEARTMRGEERRLRKLLSR